MSRSNAPAAHPGTQPGAWPQQRPAAQSSAQAAYEQDLAAWNAQQQGRWPAQASQPTQTAAQAAPQGYAPPQGYAARRTSSYAAPPQQGGYAADPRTAPPAYHYPAGNEGHDPYSRPTLGSRDLGARETTAPPSAYGHQPYPAAAPNQPYPQQSYAPEFDPYTPPMPQSSAASSYGVQPGYGHGAPSQYAAPYAQQPSHEQLSSLQPRASAAVEQAYAEPAYAAPELRGAHYDQSFEQWAQPGYPPAQGQSGPDPRGYDLGGYAPAASEPNAYRQPVSLEPAQSEWGGSEGQYDGYGQPFPQHQGNPHGQAHARPGEGGQLEPTYQQDEAGGEYELDEPPAGRRWGLIAAALVGAIAVGGGMTYGYKMFYGPNTATAAAPVVKNTGTPTKVKPAEPGGKQFAHTDSKVMGRLNDQSAAAPAAVASAASAAADADPNGARKVQTMVIGRDGSIVPSAASPPAPAAGPQPVTVPGMTIVDGFGGRPPAAALATTAAPTPARPVVVNPPAASAPPAAAAPAKPTVLARAEPVTVSDAAPVAVTKPAPAAAAAKVAVPKKAAVAAAPVAAASSGGNGFVAVLASVPASQKSSMDALKQFADMQQKYGSALVNKTPEVREANLGDKGTYHRLLVGPPSSREQAGQLCSQLKAAGYTSCWVTAY